MDIVCFISGSGTNYREIVARDPDQHYLVFTNRPGCAGEAIALKNGHEIIRLSHEPYFANALARNSGTVARNSPERLAYEKVVVNLIEKKLGKPPDLVCLAGYDLLNTDWMVQRYYHRILNVHPGDTTRGYSGLHWIPTAKAILAGESSLRSTLFFVDNNIDTGPVLVQSAPLNILSTLKKLEDEGQVNLIEELSQALKFADLAGVRTYSQFKVKATPLMITKLGDICTRLQEVLKIWGDWRIYPFAVHDLISKGLVETDGRIVYLDGKTLPPFGLRLDTSS
jgi:folate-dependent phosphoribosylglycinamide formyltransferase PurN